MDSNNLSKIITMEDFNEYKRVMENNLNISNLQEKEKILHNTIGVLEKIPSEFSRSMIIAAEQEILSLVSLSRMERLIDDFCIDDQDSEIAFIKKNIGHHAPIAAIRALSESASYGSDFNQYEYSDESLSDYGKMRKELFNAIIDIDDSSIKNGMDFIDCEINYGSYLSVVGNLPDSEVRKLIDFVYKNTGKNSMVRVALSEYIEDECNSFALPIDDIPIFINGKIEKPELIFSMKTSSSFSKVVPVIFPVHVDPANIFGKSNCHGEVLAIEKPFIKNYDDSSIDPLMVIISFSSSTVNDAYFYKIVEKSALLGFSIPDGHKICAIDINSAIGLCSKEMDHKRSHIVDHISKSIWVNPGREASTRMSGEANDEIEIRSKHGISLHELRDEIRYEGEVFHALKSHSVKNPGALSFIPNGVISILSRDLIFSWDNGTVISIITSLKNKLMINPDEGVFFLSSPQDIDKLKQANIRFNDRFYPSPDVDRSFMNNVTSGQLVELAKMGFYINSNDVPSSPLEALTMASRRVKQPVYTAALRKYDFSELLSLAKSSNHFTALQNAFPEHMDEMIDLMPRKNRGKVIADSFNL